MTLSIIPHLREGLFAFASGECMFYGYNRVRFPTAVPVGSQIRAQGVVNQVDQVDGGEPITLDLRVEINASERPGCVAQAIWRHYDFNSPT